jgi:cytochrome b subunit of formate dehydrogenase
MLFILRTPNGSTRRGRRRLRRTGIACVLAALWLVPPARPAYGQPASETCLTCHGDPDLVSADGRKMGISADAFHASIHGGLDCVSCHSSPGNYEDIPHFQHYVAVNCADCHDEAVKSYEEGFHGRARGLGNRNAPNCADCHGVDGNPHAMHALNSRTAEDACRRCHKTETALYDVSVHAQAAKERKNSPGCITCHQSHGSGLPPSAGAVSTLCETCHPGAMAQVQRGGHANIGEEYAKVWNCASCHDAHGTHKPHMSPRVSTKCVSCHQKQKDEFKGSVHEQLFAGDTMNCLSCHSTHKDEAELTRFDPGCGKCHQDVEELYRGSVHRLGRLRGSEGAATCADCHRGHHVLAAADTTSPTNHFKIPYTCGRCHGSNAVVTSEYVRLPISLPNYLASIHGIGWKRGEMTAVCTDCHGTHNLRTAQDAQSSINRSRLAETCSKCHGKIAGEYEESVHGKAVAMGITDAPTCTNCHEEHLIRKHEDPQALVSIEHRARELCGTCHTNPELVSKYGITPGVVQSYLDSYHGWAMDRKSRIAAICTDCHNKHEIRSRSDPQSSIHMGNVTKTCARCHKDANPTFAQSYTHESALRARGYHDWARLIYLYLISIVLGGMALHNLIIVRHELARHIRGRRTEPYVVRWERAERFQHLVLLLSFVGLGVTGFALRFPHQWWVKLVGLSGHEAIRADLHRALAVILITASVYHVLWISISRRGRLSLRGIAPRASDFALAFQNIAYHLGLRKTRPPFGAFDYTQKAEYWAVVWGTVVMAITGFVLWFPTIATNWFPAWTVRVAEVIHFYEAVLAVSAIVIWHFFYVIFMPREYPMSTIWLSGRMPAEEWKEMHRGDYLERGDGEVIDPRRGDDPPPPDQER